ncbi:MAG: hypothetical protein U0V48_04655 [Anaerolineales bacterium]
MAATTITPPCLFHLFNKQFGGVVLIGTSLDTILPNLKRIRRWLILLFMRETGKPLLLH